MSKLEEFVLVYDRVFVYVFAKGCTLILLVLFVLYKTFEQSYIFAVSYSESGCTLCFFYTSSAVISKWAA